MKKKALVILLIAIIISVFFCAHVNASILYGSYATDTDQQGNIIMSTTVHEMEDNTSSQHRSLLLVTVQLENISSSPTYVGYARLTIYFNDVDVYWGDLDTYSNDAYLTRRYDGQYSSFQVVPNNDFSYNDGIVVPPNSSIYAVGVIGVHNSANSDQITGFTVQNSIGTVATSDNYPYGQTVDYSPLITSLNSYFGTEHTDLTNILTLLGYLKVDTGNIYSSVDGVETLLSTIADLITYSGNNPSYSLNSASSKSSTYSGPPYMRVLRKTYPGYLIDYDFELDTTDDNPVSVGYYKIPMVVNVSTSTSKPRIYGDGNLDINNMFPTNCTVEYVGSISDVFKFYNVSDRHLNLRFVQNDGISGQIIPAYGIIPSGKTDTTLFFNLYCKVGESPNFIDFDISSFAYTFSDYNGYAPINIFESFKEYFTLWKGNSTTNGNISTDSGTLKTESDQVHTQEQQYFTQNAQAIQSTGLSNYQFSTSDGNGVAAVSLLFTDIWNSLGNWTNVYIFSLTLGLALTILRHSPSAISRIRYRNQNKGE